MRRTFLGWGRPILHSAADRLWEWAPASGPVDFSRNLIILPAARAGRRLLELLLDRSEGAGRPLRPPRLLSAGALPEALYRPARPAPGPLLERLSWRRALEEAPPGTVAALFPSLAEEESGMALMRAAVTLRALHLQVGGAGHDFASVAAVCRKLGRLGEEERWRGLAGVQGRYRNLLARCGTEDREEARRAALAAGTLHLPERIVLVGAADLPTLTRRFLEAAAAEVPVEILIGAPEALGEAFDPHGCVLSGEWADRPLGLPDDAIRVVSGPREEADEVLDALRALDGAFPAEGITIGVPDSGVVPYLVERLGEVGVPVRIAEGTPLARTSPVRLLRGIADALERNDYDAHAALLRHPAVARWLGARTRGGDGEALPVLSDRYRRDHLPLRLPRRGRIPGRERRWEGGSGAGARVEEMRALRDAFGELLDPLRARRRLSGWREPIEALLLELLGGRPISRHDTEGRALLHLAGAARGVLEQFGAIPEALDPPLPGARALRLLLEEIGEEAVPPEAEAGAVELLGWLELVLDDAPVLFLTGVNEPHLPESVSSDPFLPHTLRKALGMLDNERRWARDLLYLKTLLATRERLLLVAGRRDADGNPLRLSRLLLAEEPARVARRLLSFLGAEIDEAAEKGAEALGEGKGAGAPERAGFGEGAPGPGADPFRLPPQLWVSAPAPPSSLAVTAFRDLLADPYLFALRRLLQLEGEDDRAREMDPAGFGTLTHTVLQRFGEGEGATSEDEDRIRDLLDGLLDVEAEARFGAHPLPAVRLQLEQLRLRLRAFARWQADWVREGWRIRKVEATPPEGVAFSVDGLPFFLRGKIDRVDRNERTGAWAILDYKTGDRARSPEEAHRKGRDGAREWIDLQLPLYHRLLPALRGEGGEPLIPAVEAGRAEVGYILLPRDPEEVGISLAAWSGDELEDAEETARRLVRLLRENRFEFDATVRIPEDDRSFAAVLGLGVLRLDEEEDDDDLP